jgi:hypothetical protein
MPAGGGADHIHVGNGVGDIVNLGSGDNQSVTEGTAVVDQVYRGTGANQHITISGAQVTVYDTVAGEANVLFEALGGGSTINVGNNSSVETVRLTGTSGNTLAQTILELHLASL